jgi:hypothetical protein
MFLRKQHLMGVALLASLFSLLLVPAIAAGQGAAQTVETFTEETPWFGPDACTGLTITGLATQSGTAYITETSNGGAHVRVDIQGSVDLYQANGPGSVDLYQANGPGPWDPQPGAFIGTWTYHTTISDQAPPDGQGSTTNVTSGLLAFADGTSARRQVLFHLTWEKNGPPKLILVKFMCAGS